jgi:hypothetical protein
MSCGDSELAMRNASVWCHDWELLASYALGADYVILVCVPACDEQKIRRAVSWRMLQYQKVEWTRSPTAFTSTELPLCAPIHRLHVFHISSIIFVSRSVHLLPFSCTPTLDFSTKAPVWLAMPSRRRQWSCSPPRPISCPGALEMHLLDQSDQTT